MFIITFNILFNSWNQNLTDCLNWRLLGVTGHATRGVPAVRALIGSVRVSVGSVHSDVVLSEEGAKEHLLLYGTWSDWYEHDLSFVKLSLYIYLIRTCIIMTLPCIQREWQNATKLTYIALIIINEERLKCNVYRFSDYNGHLIKFLCLCGINSFLFRFLFRLLYWKTRKMSNTS